MLSIAIEPLCCEGLKVIISVSVA